MDNLGFILDQMAFKSMSKKDLVNRIVDETVGSKDMTSIQYRSPRLKLVERIDHYAERYGNLGLSRRKLLQLAQKELKRRENKTSRERWSAHISRMDQSA
ncbi:MAG: hypothetical protein AB7L09_02835 [Nitrospira sp.]